MFTQHVTNYGAAQWNSRNAGYAASDGHYKSYAVLVSNGSDKSYQVLGFNYSQINKYSTSFEYIPIPTFPGSVPQTPDNGSYYVIPNHVTIIKDEYLYGVWTTTFGVIDNAPISADAIYGFHVKTWSPSNVFIREKMFYTSAATSTSTAGPVSGYYTRAWNYVGDGLLFNETSGCKFVMTAYNKNIDYVGYQGI
jgi:hypothetical protein